MYSAGVVWSGGADMGALSATCGSGSAAPVQALGTAVISDGWAVRCRLARWNTFQPMTATTTAAMPATMRGEWRFTSSKAMPMGAFSGTEVSGLSRLNRSTAVCSSSARAEA